MKIPGLPLALARPAVFARLAALARPATLARPAAFARLATLARPAAVARLAVPAAAAALLAPAASATWSIVAVNTRTGEVCVASATCLDGFDLQRYLPVIVPGAGAAAAQSFVDFSGTNRVRIWNGFHNGLTPDQILERLALLDPGHQGRQYGIVGMAGDPASFTGSSAGHARYDWHLVDGDWRVAVQGNVLTGIQVVTNAADVFLSTPGDLSQKAMAAMEAAREFGGDGRCSCDKGNPTFCGCPPPSFVYSAWTAFIVVARMGDTEGICNGSVGCANGRYYCNLRVISGMGGPEPVLALQTRYTQWRHNLQNRADHILTSVTKSAQTLVADGRSRLWVEAQLANVEGIPLTSATASLTVADAYAGPAVAIVGEVTNLGAGRYRFPLTATTAAGEGRWRITVHHPDADVLLWPELVARVDPLADLHCGFDEVGAAAGAVVPLTLNLGAASAGRPYLILASASGTVPGQTFMGVHLPLNDGAVFQSSWTYAGMGNYPGTAGNLDAEGRALGSYLATPGLLAQYVGKPFHWAGVILGPPHQVTNVVSFVVGP